MRGIFLTGKISERRLATSLRRSSESRSNWRRVRSRAKPRAGRSNCRRASASERVTPGWSVISKLNPSSECLQKLRQPCRVRRPSRTGHQISIHMRLIHRNLYVFATCSTDFWSAGWVAIERATLNGTGGSQHLCTMTDGGNRFVRLRKVADDFEDAQI